MDSSGHTLQPWLEGFFCLDYHLTWTHVKRLLINISMQVDDSPKNWTWDVSHFPNQIAVLPFGDKLLTHMHLNKTSLDNWHIHGTWPMKVHALLITHVFFLGSLPAVTSGLCAPICPPVSRCHQTWLHGTPGNGPTDDGSPPPTRVTFLELQAWLSWASRNTMKYSYCGLS